MVIDTCQVGLRRSLRADPFTSRVLNHATRQSSTRTSNGTSALLRGLARITVRGRSIGWMLYVEDESKEAASSLPEPINRVPSFFAAGQIAFCCCLGVDGQCESWVGVSETRLGCLDVDTFEEETGGVGSAEVVELEPFQAGSLSCWIPDPM
jgi:hypothetical protein